MSIYEVQKLLYELLSTELEQERGTLGFIWAFTTYLVTLIVIKC